MISRPQLPSRLKRGLLVSASGVIAMVIILLLLPLPSALRENSAAHPVRVLDRNGLLLYEFRRGAPGSQEWLPYAELPPIAIRALIDIEDRTFLEHSGISVRGIFRALYQNITSGRIVSGGSTITQQLVRVRLSSDASHRTYLSKILEAYFAIKLDLKLSKQEILEAYLNSAYFGHQAYGLQAASKTYFGKSAQELSLAETSLLIGLLQSPSGYDPFQTLARARERQKAVLTAMVTQGDITEEQQQESAAAQILLAPDRVEIEAPHFVFWVLSRNDLPSDATEIRTTLDLGLQNEVERAIANHLETLTDKNVTSAAVVILDARTGDVLAMAGSSDYFDRAHDGAVNVALAPRQPGSAIKPFTYALALAKGDTAATTVADVETQFLTQEGNPYIPRNYDYGYHGLVRYREALANSFNIAAVKVAERVGVANLLQFLRSNGITTLQETPEHYGLALTLGDAEVTLLELTRAYGTFARAGKTLRERSLLSDPAQSSHQVLDPKVSWLISDILSDNTARLAEFGSEGPLQFDFPVAAKTGTTRNSRDNWTIGYTPSRVVGVWVGNADNSPMKGTSGVTGAGPIFHDVVLVAQRNLPREVFPRPTGIIDQRICMLSGKPPRLALDDNGQLAPNCPQTMTEKFIEGTEPKSLDDIYQTIAIDTRNGLRAGESCPQKFVQKLTFAVFPLELQRWARENGWKEAPGKISPLCGKGLGLGLGLGLGDVEQRLTITHPKNNDVFLLDPLVPNAQEKIIFEARADAGISSVDWLVNGVKIGTGKAPDFRVQWKPGVGRFRVEVKSGTLHDEASFVVRKP